MASPSHRAPLAPSSASQVLVAMPDFDLEKCLARLDPKERAKYDSEEFKKTAEAAFDQADVTQSALACSYYSVRVVCTAALHV